MGGSVPGPTTLESIVNTDSDDLFEREPDDPDKSAAQLSILLSASTAVIDEEFKRSERLDNKSRSQVAVTAAIYAAVQAGAISLLNGLLRPATGETATIAIVLAVIAAVAAAAMIAAIAVSYEAWKLRDEDALSVATIKKYRHWAYMGHPLVAVRLIDAYAKIADDRRANNELRAAALTKATYACGVALLITGLELIVAFAAVATS